MSETSQPRPDPRTTTSPDVPSSTDPQDIKDGLSKSPELSKLEILQNKTLKLSEAIKNLDAETAKLSPDMVDELEQHAKVREKLQGEMKSLFKEISEHAQKSGKSGPANSNGGKMLHFPVLDKAWELLMVALKALMELFAKGARFLRNLLPNAPANNAADSGAPKPAESKPASKEKTTIGVSLPGGPVAVRPPEAKAVKAATPDEVQEAGDQAIQDVAFRQKDIKNTLDAEAENANDNDSPEPGSATRKPK